MLVKDFPGEWDERLDLREGARERSCRLEPARYVQLKIQRLRDAKSLTCEVRNCNKAESWPP
jgi:hypothetical protein